MIRPSVVYNTINELSRSNQGLPFRPEEVEKAFPFFYFGFLFNKKLKEIDSVINLRVQVGRDEFADFPLGEFEAHLPAQRIADRSCQFRLVAIARPPAAGDHEIPNDMEFPLASGETVTIEFDRSNVVKPELAEGETRAEPRRGMGRLREELSQVDRSRLDTVALQASTAVIEFLKGDSESRIRKELEEFCFDLYCGVRVMAAYQVINSSYVGDKGEDVLVKNLFSGQVKGGFSSTFGTSAEWIKSCVPDSHNNRHERIEPTDEEYEVINAYGKLLQEAVEKDKSE